MAPIRGQRVGVSRSAVAEEAVYLILAAAAVFTRRERRKALALVDVRRAVETLPARCARAGVSVYRAFRAGGAVFTRQREAFLHVVCTRFSLPASCAAARKSINALRTLPGIQTGRGAAFVYIHAAGLTGISWLTDASEFICGTSGIGA